MSENSKMDLQLSEEQLYAITGGVGFCDQCAVDHANIEALLAHANNSLDARAQAAAQGNQEAAMYHHAQFEHALQTAQNALNIISVRHNYHMPSGSGSGKRPSSSLPPLAPKRPRR